MGSALLRGAKPIKEEQKDGVSFIVDDVAPARKLAVVSAQQVQDRFKKQKHWNCTCFNGDTIESCNVDGEKPWLKKQRGLHGFVDAAITAFDTHYPLALRPDDILQLVLEAWSCHVNDNAEELRNNFVSFQGKRKITIDRDDFVLHGKHNDWPSLFAQFSAQIKTQTTAGLFEAVSSEPFSTTTPADQVAREITLMSATKAYFSFGIRTCCGFPYIRLLGTADDWRFLRSKVNQLKPFMTNDFAAYWLPALDSILSKFEDAFRGDIDKFFWSSMVKYYSRRGSGASDYITGWINVFFPSFRKCRNALCLPWLEHKKLLVDGPRSASGNDITNFAMAFSTAPITWNYWGREVELEFKTGFIGAVQDSATGEISPRLAWAVVEPGVCQCK